MTEELTLAIKRHEKVSRRRDNEANAIRAGRGVASKCMAQVS